MFSKAHRKTTWLTLVLVPVVFSVAGSTAHAAPKPKASTKTPRKASLNNALFDAINKNNLHAVQTLLARGADVNARNEDKLTPLMAALNDCDKSAISLQIIEALVNKKANVNAKDGEGTGVLIYGVDSGSLPIIQLLLRHGADVNTHGQYDETPLSRAVNQNNPSIIKLLLDAGASAKGGILTQLAAATDNIAVAQLFLAHGADVNEKDSSGTTPLMQAASTGHTAMVTFLLQKGALLEAKNIPEGETALRQAVANNKIETAGLLLAAGANPNTQDSEGMTVLDEAIMDNMGREDTDFVHLLLDKGATPSSGALQDAARFGERQVMELLLAHGAGAHISKEELTGALIGVLMFGNMEPVRMGLYGYAATLSDKEKADAIAKAEANDTAIVKHLLDLGMDFTTYPNNRVLTFAAIDGVPSIIRLLLDKGAPVDGGNLKTPTQPDDFFSHLSAEVIPNNMTPLMAAAAGGHADVCQILLDAGANPNLKDTDGQTALMLLTQSGRNKIAFNLPRLRESVLHRADDSAEKPTSRGVKPAEAAAMQKWADEGDTAIIKALLAKKADVQTTGKQGQTALMLAAANSSPAVVQTLIEAGAAINFQNAAGQNALMQVVEHGRISRAPQLFSFELQEAAQYVTRGGPLFQTADGKKIAADTKAAAAKQKAAVINATTAEDTAVIKVLLAAGINLNAKDKKGQTALQMARKTHHAAIIALLEQAEKRPEK